MYVGILTSPLRNQTLDYVIEFAGSNDIAGLEVASGPGASHLDITTFTADRAGEIRKKLDANNVRISSLAWYTDPVNAPDREQTIANFRLFIDAAKMLEVDTVCTLAGMPAAGKTKLDTIEADCPGVFNPILDYAASKGIKVALENWFATNLQGLAEFDRIFQVLPNENFGLNFDPSHLLWQGIDYIGAVHRFADRIFHTHAKDTEVRDDQLAYLGNQAKGWWRYVIPGFGRVKWGEYVAALRKAKYDGVLSIEHEDGTFKPEEGFIKGKNYLKLFV